MALKRAHVLVSGRVQGVFFRASCAEQARARGLTGSVRNTTDGRVDATFEGDDAMVDAMVAWCREGPPWARVESVEVQEERPEGDREFVIV
jgi:acylphosphatase